MAPQSPDAVMLMMVFSKHPCYFNFWANGRIGCLAPLWSEGGGGCSGQLGCSGNDRHHFQVGFFLGRMENRQGALHLWARPGIIDVHS